MQKTFIPRSLTISLISCLLLLFTTKVSAQGAAEVWLDKAMEKLQNKGSEIAFRINEENIRLSGKLLIDGEKFLYDTEDMKIWYDGATQWTLQLGSGYNVSTLNASVVSSKGKSSVAFCLLRQYVRASSMFMAVCITIRG